MVAGPGLAARPGATEPERFTCGPTPDAFAAALLRMLDDDALRATVTREGMAAAAAYTPEVFLSRLVEIYDRVVSTPRR